MAADALSIIWVGTAIALFFLLMRLLGGSLAGGDGSGASVGKAILTVFP